MEGFNQRHGAGQPFDMVGHAAPVIRLLFFGDGAEKCRQVLKRKNAGFEDEFRISAAFMHEPAYKSLREHKFEDIAYFEPFYLKDFITSRPKKNILGR